VARTSRLEQALWYGMGDGQRRSLTTHTLREAQGRPAVRRWELQEVRGEPVSGLLGFDDTDKCLACRMPTRARQRAMPPWAVALSRQGYAMA
jgi:hypothetical protein